MENAITLEREYDGETIKVKVWKDYDLGIKSSELEVIVDKKNGSSLEFTCTAFPHQITIRSVTSKNPETSDYEFGYSDFEYASIPSPIYIFLINLYCALLNLFQLFEGI